MADAAAPSEAPEAPFLGPNEALGGVSVGDSADWERKVLQEHVDQYANITGDTNPLHFDPSYAEKTVFKNLITHGGIQAGALNALVAMKLPGPGSVFMSQELKYTAPVRVGDTVKAVGKVTKVHAKKPVCTMEIQVFTTPEGEGAETKEVMSGTVVVYRAVPKTD